MTQIKYDPGKTNNAKNGKKLSWFSHYLRHSTRKRDGLILQRSWAYTRERQHRKRTETPWRRLVRQDRRDCLAGGGWRLVICGGVECDLACHPPIRSFHRQQLQLLRRCSIARCVTSRRCRRWSGSQRYASELPSTSRSLYCRRQQPAIVTATAAMWCYSVHLHRLYLTWFTVLLHCRSSCLQQTLS